MSSQAPSIIFGQRINPAGEESTASDLQQLVGKLISILRHRRWLFVLPMLAGMAVVLTIMLLTPRQYLLRTVFERRDDPVTVKLVANSPYNVDSVRKSLRFSLVGYEVVCKAVADLGMGGKGVPENVSEERCKAIADKIQPQLGAVVLDTNENFDLIELHYSGDEPALAERILGSLKDRYIHDTQSTMISLQQQAQKFFSQEVDRRRTRLAEMQAQLTQQLIDQPELDPARPDWFKERLTAESVAIEQLNRTVHDINAEIEAREDYLKNLEEQQKQGKLPSSSVFATKVVNDPRRNELEASIAHIVSEISDAKTVRNMKDTHPYVESLNRKLAQLKLDQERLPQVIAGQMIESASADTPWDAERQRINMEMKTFRGKLEQVQHDLIAHQTARTEIESQKGTIFERQQGYTLRRQEADNIRTDLAVWQSKLEEINRVLAAANMDRGTRFRTVEECRLPDKPVNPKLSTAFMLSSGIGLALGIVAVFIREMFDRSFRNPARVRQVLGIPVLETIGELMIGSPSRRWARRAVLPIIAGCQLLVVAALGSLNYLSIEHPDRYAQWMSIFWGHLSPYVTWLT